MQILCKYFVLLGPPRKLHCYMNGNHLNLIRYIATRNCLSSKQTNDATQSIQDKIKVLIKKVLCSSLLLVQKIQIHLLSSLNNGVFKKV